MKLLLDTHVLLWAAAAPDRLPDDARTLLEDRATEPIFSAASLWEVAIKNGLGRADFRVDPRLLRRGLLEHGYTELAVTGTHAVAVDLLPPLHGDPFDRILIVQAQIEGIVLLTADAMVARYTGADSRDLTGPAAVGGLDGHSRVAVTASSGGATPISLCRRHAVLAYWPNQPWRCGITDSLTIRNLDDRVPGCTTTVADTLPAALDAIAGWIEIQSERGQLVSEPSMCVDPDGGRVALVTVPDGVPA